MEGLALRNHGNRLERVSNVQVPIPAPETGKDEKSGKVFNPLLIQRRGFFIPHISLIFMSETHGFMKALKCRECGREYPLAATHVCEFDFGPLEVVYDYDRIKGSLTKSAIASRRQNMWRYRELLPVAKEPTVGCEVGFTPLIKADRLAKRLGIRELWIKNDAVNYPTLSFKDRVVSVALSRARELGFTTVACASTGNLANSVAANAAAAGLKA